LQQCIALAALRMHTSKERKKNYKKEMFRYSDQFIEIAVLTPPRHGVFSVIMMKLLTPILQIPICEIYMVDHPSSV
jgi:hypothetical protein